MPEQDQNNLHGHRLLRWVLILTKIAFGLCQFFGGKLNGEYNVSLGRSNMALARYKELMTI